MHEDSAPWTVSCTFHNSVVGCRTTAQVSHGGVPMEIRKHVLTSCILSLLLCMVSVLTAQVQNGQFTGTVTDPTGAAIANAKVTVSNVATNLSVSVATNSSGNYTAKELPIGSYKLTAESPGFKTTSNSEVVLNAGVIAHVNFKLQIGKASEIVEVTGAETTIQTEDAKLYSTVSSTEINNYALNGRNVFDLMTLSAGAVNVQGVDFDAGNNHTTAGAEVNGVRENYRTRSEEHTSELQSHLNPVSR